jgi:VWFA-related protein
MAGELPEVQKCGTALIASLGADDRASVVELKERVNVLQLLTSTQADLDAAMTHLVEGGETALYDGLYVALAQLGSRPKQTSHDIRSRVLVVVTDGADTTSLVTFDQLVEQARHQAIAIYVVRRQSKELSRELSKREIVAAHRAMDVLALETGGRVLTAEHGDLSSLCGTIARELAERYTVGYVSSNTRRDGGYRQISVRVTGRPDLIARTRASYISK